MNRRTILFLMAMMVCILKLTAQSNKLSPPQNVKASDGLYPEHIKISWDALGDGALYKIYRSESQQTQGMAEISKGWQQANFLIDKNQLVSDRRYYYRIKARKGSLESDLSMADVGYLPSIASPNDSLSIKTTNEDNLNISLQAIEKDTLVARDSFYVAYAVQSKVQEQLSQIELRFYLSKNNQPEVTDVVIGSVKLDKLSPLSSQRGSVRLKADGRTKSGQYCLVMMSYQTGKNNKTLTTFKKVMIQ
jgi:fibronectin type 3 domain-containing protein